MRGAGGREQALRIVKWSCVVLFLSLYVALPALAVDPRVSWLLLVAVLPLVWPDLAALWRWTAARYIRARPRP